MSWFNELLKIVVHRWSEMQTAVANLTWEGFVHSITHMGPVDAIGWVVTFLFLIYHGIKNQRIRLVVAKICSVITIFYFFLRGDLPMFTKWWACFFINIYMWFSLKSYTPKGSCKCGMTKTLEPLVE